MVHLLPTILSTRARCGVEIPTNATRSTMPPNGEWSIDPAAYCAKCFKAFSHDDFFLRNAPSLGSSITGYPFDIL